MTKSQMRGYLYEILISHLLIKNNFRKCIQNTDGPSDCGLVSETLGSGDKNKPQKIPNNFYKILYIMFVGKRAFKI